MLHTRASVLHDAGRLQESEASVREAIAVRRGLGDVLPRDQVARLSDSLELLANVLTADRRLAEADALSAEVLTMRERVGWSERARGLLNRSATLLAAGREAEGLEVAMELVRGALDQPGESGAPTSRSSTDWSTSACCCASTATGSRHWQSSSRL